MMSHYGLTGELVIAPFMSPIAGMMMLISFAGMAAIVPEGFNEVVIVATYGEGE